MFSHAVLKIHPFSAGRVRDTYTVVFEKTFILETAASDNILGPLYRLARSRGICITSVAVE